MVRPQTIVCPSSKKSVEFENVNHNNGHSVLRLPYEVIHYTDQNALPFLLARQLVPIVQLNSQEDKNLNIRKKK